MESDPDHPPLANAVHYYLPIVCLGWYTFQWFIQLVGVFSA